MDNECATWTTLMMWPFVFTVSHQFVYYVLVQCVCYRRIVSDKNALTTYRYLFRKSAQKGLMWRMINVLGKRGRIYVFGGFFVSYSTLSFIPTMLLFRYWWLQFAFILLCGTWAIKNGADFYAKVYVKKRRTQGDDVADVE